MNNQSYPLAKQSQYNSNLFNSNISQQKSGPKSQRSVNLSANGSIKSNNAVEGSIKGSVISFNSGQSKKSQKSILSMYPQMISKQAQNVHNTGAQSVGNLSIKQQKAASNQCKHTDEGKAIKKPVKASWYIDQDFYYSSQFKRNFVKGMISLAINKNIDDIVLLLREIAPTMMIRSCDTMVWVSAFLIIFRIEQKIRRMKLKQEQILQQIEDGLVEFMLKNRQIKKSRLMKIVIYLLRELPVNKPKIMSWFEEFIRKNRQRLFGIDISKYIDIHSLNPVPIDYNKLNKSASIKVKNMEKEKERERRREIEKDRNREKERQIVGEIVFEKKSESNVMGSNIGIVNSQLNNINDIYNSQSRQLEDGSKLVQVGKDHGEGSVSNRSRGNGQNKEKQNMMPILIGEQGIGSQRNQGVKKGSQNKLTQKIKNINNEVNQLAESKQPKTPTPTDNKPQKPKLQQSPIQISSNQLPLNTPNFSTEQFHHSPEPPPPQQFKQQKGSWLYTKLAERLESSSYCNTNSRPKMKNNNNFVLRNQCREIMSIEKIESKNCLNSGCKGESRNTGESQKGYREIQLEIEHSNQEQSNLSANSKLSIRNKIKQIVKNRSEEIKSGLVIEREHEKQRESQAKKGNQ